MAKSKYVVDEQMDKAMDNYIAYLFYKTTKYRFSLDFDDFRSHCLYEYIKCVRRWDSKKDVPINYFVRNRLKNALLDYMRKNGEYSRNNVKRPEFFSINRLEEDRENHSWQGEVWLRKGLPFPEELMTLPPSDFYIDFDKILKLLTPREQDILRRHCIEDEDYKDIGASLGITGSRISQIMIMIGKKVKKVLAVG